jgi:hypothetical protein
MTNALPNTATRQLSSGLKSIAKPKQHKRFAQVRSQPTTHAIYHISIDQYQPRVILSFVVWFLLTRSAIEAQQQQQQPQLIKPSQDGDDAAVLELLANRAQANCHDWFGLSALHHAAINGHTSVCRILIEHGADCAARSVCFMWHDRAQTASDFLTACMQTSQNKASGRFATFNDKTPSECAERAEVAHAIRNGACVIVLLMAVLVTHCYFLPI